MSKFTFTDEVNDTFTAIHSGTSVAVHTHGEQGIGPLVVLSQEQRVEFAEFLLQGTSHRVVQITKLEQALSETNQTTHVHAQNPPVSLIEQAINKQNESHGACALSPAHQLVDFLNEQHPTQHFAVSPGGKKYQRVTQTPIHDGKVTNHGGSVHCFVDAEGNIYKAAGWKAPAKHVRATVANVLNGTTKTDPYGSWLYM